MPVPAGQRPTGTSQFVFCQVFRRYVLNSSPTWMENAPRSWSSRRPQLAGRWAGAMPATSGRSAVRDLTTPCVVFLLINIILFALGTFMHIAATILICTPIFLPIAMKYGMDLVQFGMLMLINCAMDSTRRWSEPRSCSWIAPSVVVPTVRRWTRKGVTGVAAFWQDASTGSVRPAAYAPIRRVAGDPSHDAVFRGSGSSHALRDVVA